MATDPRAKRPPAWKILFDAFQRSRENSRAFAFLSDGINVCIDNAASLLDNFKLLAAHKRNSLAQFSYATALEEMGKALLLLDLVRIEWKREEWLHRLCKAFYSHLEKGGYARIVIDPGSGALTDALQLYKFALAEYMPTHDPETGEPDWLAESIMEREWAVYVDWWEHDGRWFYPPDSSLAHYFAQEKFLDDRPAGEEKVAALLEPLLRARRQGLFTPESLRIIHEQWSLNCIEAGLDERTLAATLEKTASILRSAGVGVSDETIGTNFLKYPLYAVLLVPDRVPRS